MVDPSLEQVDLYELKVLRICMQHSPDLFKPLPANYVLPSGTPTRALLSVALKLLSKVKTHLQTHDGPLKNNIDLHQSFINLQKCLSTLTNDTSWKKDADKKDADTGLLHPDNAEFLAFLRHVVH